LHQLAPNLIKISSLEFSYLDLQLLPGSGYHSVLGAAAAPTLKQLRLDRCTLAKSSRTSKTQGLAAALALLPELEHLALAVMSDVFIPDGVWLKMSRLTYLELEGAHLQAPGEKIDSTCQFSPNWVTCGCRGCMAFAPPLSAHCQAYIT
jgi:hypothetical protein